LGCWISPCYGPFSLGGRFETYEPFFPLIFKFFSGCGKPRITGTADTVSVDTGAPLYIIKELYSGAGRSEADYSTMCS
jgi:hypothetical protein